MVLERLWSAFSRIPKWRQTANGLSLPQQISWRDIRGRDSVQRHSMRLATYLLMTQCAPSGEHGLLDARRSL